MADNVIEFLVKEEIPAADIHHRLQRVYGDAFIGASCVRRPFVYTDKKWNQKNMKECDKRKSHKSSNLHMMYISSNDGRHPVTKNFTPLHPTTLHSTSLHLSTLRLLSFKLHPTTLH